MEPESLVPIPGPWVDWESRRLHAIELSRDRDVGSARGRSETSVGWTRRACGESFMNVMDAYDQWHSVSVRVPLANAEHATIVKRVIEVDKELQSHVVKRTLNVEADTLVATFHTLTVRLARLTLNSFLENVDLIVRVLEEFGNDAAKSKATTT